LLVPESVVQRDERDPCPGGSEQAGRKKRAIDAEVDQPVGIPSTQYARSGETAPAEALRCCSSVTKAQHDAVTETIGGHVKE
jgi:hypothetical protein